MYSYLQFGRFDDSSIACIVILYILDENNVTMYWAHNLTCRVWVKMMATFNNYQIVKFDYNICNSIADGKNYIPSSKKIYRHSAIY